MMRLQQALSVGDAHGFISRWPLSRSLFCPWHNHDFLCRHGRCLWSYESHCPFANWSQRCCLSLFKCSWFLAFCRWLLLLTLVSLAIGKFSAAGWLAYPPLSGIEYSPDEGVDYWIWIVQIAGVGSTLSGINFLGHDSENALSRNDFDENAHLCLERAYAPWSLSFLPFRF